MNVTSTQYTASSVRPLADAESKKSSGSSGLGKDDFLKLLVAQLSNQDPMASTDSSQFIAQLAQFTLLEQMSAVSTALENTQALSMIGKIVYIEDSETEEVIYGKVDGVVQQGGVNYLVVGDETYELADISGVLDGEVANVTDQELLNSANLVGQTVTATYTDEESEEAVTVTGIVDKIIIEDGRIYVMVDDKKIPLSAIEEITN